MGDAKSVREDVRLHWSGFLGQENNGTPTTLAALTQRFKAYFTTLTAIVIELSGKLHELLLDLANQPVERLLR